MTASRPWKPTKLQQDVLDRLRDGWELHGLMSGITIRRPGDPSRHVRYQTISALERHGVLRWVHRSETKNKLSGQWVLA